MVVFIAENCNRFSTGTTLWLLPIEWVILLILSLSPSWPFLSFLEPEWGSYISIIFLHTSSQRHGEREYHHFSLFSLFFHVEIWQNCGQFSFAVFSLFLSFGLLFLFHGQPMSGVAIHQINKSHFLLHFSIHLLVSTEYFGTVFFCFSSKVIFSEVCLFLPPVQECSKQTVCSFCCFLLFFWFSNCCFPLFLSLCFPLFSTFFSFSVAPSGDTPL